MWYDQWFNEGDTITDEGLIQYGLQEGLVVNDGSNNSKYDLDNDGDFDKDDVSLAGATLSKAKELKEEEQEPKKTTTKKKKAKKKKSKKK